MMIFLIRDSDNLPRDLDNWASGSTINLESKKDTEYLVSTRVYAFYGIGIDLDLL